ncbi:hypothetical protein Tco_0002282 [Tanacetum coccineum]
MPSFPSPGPTVSYFDDLDFFKDFEKEFPAIVYNDALTFKSDFLTETTVSPQHIDEFDLKDETSLFECEKEEKNVLYFKDLLPFNVIYPDDLKSDTDNDNDKIDIEQPSGDMSIIPSANCADDVVDFRTWPGISLETSMISTMDLDGVTCLNVIMESLLKKKQKGAILELKRRHWKKFEFCINTPYPAKKIRRISASSSQERVLINS